MGGCCVEAMDLVTAIGSGPGGDFCPVREMLSYDGYIADGLGSQGFAWDLAKGGRPLEPLMF